MASCGATTSTSRLRSIGYCGARRASSLKHSGFAALTQAFVFPERLSACGGAPWTSRLA